MNVVLYISTTFICNNGGSIDGRNNSTISNYSTGKILEFKGQNSIDGIAFYISASNADVQCCCQLYLF